MRCSLCKKELGRGSKSYRCSDCNKLYMAEYRKNNLEKVKQSQRNHYKSNRDLVLEKVKQYRESNPEKVKEMQAAKYDKNKEKIRKKNKEWQLNNLDRVKEAQRIGCLNRVARKKKAEGRHTIQDIRLMYDTQKGKCNFCKGSILDGYHVDHIEPLSKGGSNWPNNLQLLCPTCNCKKHAMSMDEFIKRNRVGG